MKNVIIVHGCPSKKEKNIGVENRTYHKHWVPWIRKELVAKGIKVEAPLMPEPWEPSYEKWRERINGFDINKDSVLVGHSCGGGFLVRYLGDVKKKISKLILVAPAISHSGYYKLLNDLLRFEINPKVNNLAEEIIIFSSNDDSEGILKSIDIFSKKIDCKIIELDGRGHFVFEDMGTEEFPELLEEIIND